MKRFVLITGCSCAGKSTLLSALQSAGYAVVTEPGRRIVTEELAREGTALPWVDPAAFARRAIDVSRADLAEAFTENGPVFFDRGLIDAAVALEHAEGVPVAETLASSRPYSDPVFLAPPWPGLFENDESRRHDFTEAKAEFKRIETALGDLGYDMRRLPRGPVAARLKFVLSSLS